MTLRIFAAATLALGAALFITFLHVLGEGPFASLESRHLREMKERRDAPARLEPIALAEFLALPHHRSVGEYSGYERRGVTMEGYVQNVLRASDGDVHLEIVTLPRSPAAEDTSYISAEITPSFRRKAPAWGLERLLQTFRPQLGDQVPWPTLAPRVRIGGWLMYDWQYDDPDRDRQGSNAKRLTGWEIHPVTQIEVWDDSLARFVELPR